MTKLNDTQMDMLAAVAEAHAAFMEALPSIEAEVQALRREKVNQAAERRDTLAALAAAGGVPIRRLAEEALGTKNRRTASRAVDHGNELISA